MKNNAPKYRMDHDMVDTELRRQGINNVTLVCINEAGRIKPRIFFDFVPKVSITGEKRGPTRRGFKSQWGRAAMKPSRDLPSAYWRLMSLLQGARRAT